jgi:hypothetical protein
MKRTFSLLAALAALAPAACDRGGEDRQAVAVADKAAPVAVADKAAPVAVADEAAPAARSFGELTVDQVAEKIGKPGVYLYDNNNREEWVEGHVPTATWLDYGAITAKDLPADKDATLIFYCHNEH